MESGGRGALVSVEERSALVLLRLLPGVGDRRLSRLLGTAGSARRALALTSRQFVKTLGAKAEGARRDPGIRRQADRVLERCEALRIEILSLGLAILSHRPDGPRGPSSRPLPQREPLPSEPKEHCDCWISACHWGWQTDRREDFARVVRVRCHGRERARAGD